MDRNSTRQSPETREGMAAPYEPPRIEDHGTLVELTAGKGNADPDFYGCNDKNGGGGYS